jgi:hypothetical protein
MHRATVIFTAVLASRVVTAAGGDFQGDVTGFLDRHCIDCHAGPNPEMGLALDGFRDESAVLAARPRWRQILSRVAAGEMPPPDAEQPVEADRDAFLRAIREAFARADAAPPDPGPTVIRRLSRAEYGNTMRDLFGTDLRSAANFPPDGVGYGFTNIADVLTVSPLLMERYLDAAEQVAARVLPVEPPKPVRREMAGRHCEPANPHVPRGRFRPIRASESELIQSGPLNTTAAIDPDGEYVVRSRLYATSPDGRPVRAALMVAGRKMTERLAPEQLARLDGGGLSNPEPRVILQEFEITARSPEEPQTIEAPLVRLRGVERILVGALKPDSGAECPTLHVEWLGYDGPRDPRSTATRSFLRVDPALPQAEQDRENLRRLATRGWRRPVEPEVVDTLCRLVDEAVAAGRGHDAGLREAIAAVLAAPECVFRIEAPPPAGSVGAVPVPDVELATRLSYFLWSSCPDEELLDLAIRGALAANLDAQVRRMLADPKSAALVDQFAMQWLGLGRLAVHGVDAERFPLWRPELAAAMVEETRRYVADVFRGDRSLLLLLDSDFTWVNFNLAAVYGLDPQPPLKKNEWRRVAVDPAVRGGLLTQAAVLTVTANPARTSPVKRGKWVLEQVLGAPPPMAPPNVPSIEDAARRQLTGTFRERMEQHRANSGCAGCHARMDAFGFALERYDPIGQWRDKDSDGLPVDTKSDVGGRLIDGLPGLKAYLLERRSDFVHCLSTKMLIYALGRGLELGDEPALAGIERTVEASGYRFSILVRAIVMSPPFRLRRGADQEAAATGGSP